MEARASEGRDKNPSLNNRGNEKKRVNEDFPDYGCCYCDRDLVNRHDLDTHMRWCRRLFVDSDG